MSTLAYKLWTTLSRNFVETSQGSPMVNRSLSSRKSAKDQRQQSKRKPKQQSSQTNSVILSTQRIIVTLPVRHFPCQITQLRTHRVAASSTSHLQVMKGSLLNTMHQMAVSLHYSCYTIFSKYQLLEFSLRTTTAGTGRHSTVLPVGYLTQSIPCGNSISPFVAL